MESNLGAQQVVSTTQVGNDARAQYAQYLEQEPESRLTLHRWVKRFQAASVGLAVGVFVKALIVSINWTHAAPLEIPFWWMCFALGGVLPTVCLGLDVIILRAAVLPIRFDKIRKVVTVTGRQAVIAGMGIILAALAWGGLIVALAYSMVTFNRDMMQVTIGIFTALVGIVFVVQFLSTLIRDLSRTPAK